MENQDAINTLYELAKLDGYENSMDDFKATMANNPEAVKTMYELALKDGYENSINDFSKLVGSKKKNFSDSSGGQNTGGSTSGESSSDTAQYTDFDNVGQSYWELEKTIDPDKQDVKGGEFATPQNLQSEISMEFDDEVILENIKKNQIENQNNPLLTSKYKYQRGDSKKNFLGRYFYTDSPAGKEMDINITDLNYPFRMLTMTNEEMIDELSDGVTKNGIKLPNGVFHVVGTPKYELAMAIIDDQATGDEIVIDYSSPTLSNKTSETPSIFQPIYDARPTFSEKERKSLVNYGSGITKPQLNKFGVNVDEYIAFQKTNSQKEGAVYRMLTYGTADETTGEAYLEEKQYTKLKAFKINKLEQISKDLNLVEKLILTETNPEEYKKLMKKQAEIQMVFLNQYNNLADNKLTKEAFPNYWEHLHADGPLQLMKRKRKYYAARASDDVAFGHFLGETSSAAGVGGLDFLMGTAAFVPAKLDEVTSLGGTLTNKGLFKGLEEMFTNIPKQYKASEIGPTERPIYSSGKEIMYNGELYMVTDEGQVLDHKTNILMDGIISKEEINEIKKQALGVTETSYNTTAGSIIPAGVSTLINMYALIRTGKAISKKTGLSGSWGMGIASYTSSVTSNVASVKESLQAAGLSEGDAAQRAILYGNAISTLDGIVSGIMGPNTKILSNSKSIKKQLLDLITNPSTGAEAAKNFSATEFKRKFKDLTVELVKEEFEEMTVYAGEKMVNKVINYDIGQMVRSDEFKAAEMFEVAALTFGSTSTLGANALFKNNTRADFTNFLSKDIKATRDALLKLEKEGLITKDEASKAYGEVYSMAAANNNVKGSVKISENIVPMADLLYRRQALKEEGKNLEGPLKNAKDKQIADIDQQIQTLYDKDVSEVDLLIKEQNAKGNKESAIKALDKENLKRKEEGLEPIEINKKNIDKKINELKDANKEPSTVSETETDTASTVSEVDDGVSSEIPGSTTEGNTDNENEASETKKTKITSSTNKNLEFELVDGELIVKNKKSGKSRKASKKQEADFISQSEFGATDVEVDSNVSEDKNNKRIIAESRSPIQLAKLIESLETNVDGDSDSETSWESMFRGYKVNPLSFKNFSDKSFVTKGMNARWMQKQNKNPSLNESSGGSDLDVIAQELSSETGMNITPEMLVDYMNSNPNNKAPESTKNRRNQTKVDANKKFTELTGLRPTKENIALMAGKDPDANSNQDLEAEAADKEAFDKEENRKKEQYEDFDPAKDISSDSDKDSDNNNEEKPDTYFQRAKDYLNEQASKRYTQFVDKYSGVRKLQKAIENFTGRNQKDNSNFDKAEKVVYGKIRNKLEKFNKSMSNFLFKLNNKGISTKDLDNYLYAKHSVERNKTNRERGSDNDSSSGMTDKKSNDILKELQKRLGDKMSDLETAADFIYKTSRETLDMQLKSGLLSKTAYDNTLKNQWKTYVPLTGFAENDPKKAKENKSGKPMGKGLQAGKSKTKMTGRKTEAQSPIASIMQRRTDAIMNIDKNNVLVKLFNMLKGNSNTDQYVFYNKGNPKKIMVPEPGNALNKIEVEMRPDEMAADPAMVRVMINGVENYIDFVADPSIGTILKTGLGIDAEQTNAILRASRKVLTFMRKVYTTLSPEFVVSNYLRDIQTGVMNAIADKDIPLFSKNMAKTVTDLVMTSGKSFKTIRAVTLGKTQDADGNTLSDAELKKKGYDVEMVKYYDEFLAEGGQTGYGYTQSLEEVKKDVDAIENPTNFKKFSKGLNNLIDSFNNAAENSTRLSAYIMAKKDGMTNQEAAALAKDLTINFNQSGTQQNFSALYLFFNASVQGTVRFGKAIGISNFQDTKAGEGNKILNALGIKDKKLNPAQKLATALTSFSAMIAFANISFGDEDEDGVPYYDKIPEAIKRRNLVIMRPGTDGEYIKIPLPYGYNIFHNVGTGAMDSAVGDKTAGEFATNLSVSALEAFSPVSLSDADGFEGGVINAMPSAFRPIFEVAFNQNYFGQQISNEGFPTETTPDSQKGRYTKSSFKKISRFLAEAGNEFGGGTVSSSAGLLDVNPDSIDYLMQQYLGTLYTLPKLASDSFEQAISDKPYEFNINKIPIARRFYGQPSRFTNQQLFYDRSLFAKSLVDQYMSSITGEEPIRFSKKTYQDGIALVEMSKEIKKDLKKIRDTRKILRKKELTAADFATLKKLEKVEDKMFNVFNKIFLKKFKRYSTANKPVSADN